METCGREACWVGWGPTMDQSGIKTEAGGRTGHSVQGWAQRAAVGAGFPSEYWKVEADERLLSDE